MQTDLSLSTKYNVPVPRYTSYPTVPFWKDGMDLPRWKQVFARQFRENNRQEGISLYIHLPFCESLCIYCGCNKKITANHSVEDPYIDAVLKEWNEYRTLMEEPPVIREIHLGGGTPTFFSPASLYRLIQGLLKGAFIHPQHAFSLEGHPNNTTKEHLDVLYGLGFRRISYGIQDINPEVQKIIHRIQPFENVKRATEAARKAGFTSVNFDLVYGLPRQDADRLANTIRQSIGLNPDRIAFYSYAHTPWVNCAQRLIDERDLPSAAEKLALHRQGRELLIAGGYTDIGMDHFALPADELYVAWKKGRLHRNFMGYTSRKSALLLGLGVSSISDAGIAFAQNDKTLAGYYQAIASGQMAVKKGYFLTEEDLVFRNHILDITCKGRTSFNEAWLATLQEYTFPVLRQLENDGLVRVDEKEVEVTAAGHPFIRNICKAFDLRLLREESARAHGENSVLCGKSALSQRTSGDTSGEAGKEAGKAPDSTRIFSNAI